ncbi:ROK family protein [Nocardioides marinisabuli]|uniref:ROK family protein n=1 Tax=Nocardioides marinisabuli TaxID=419476 RepID=UPI0015DF0242|nr:ROK family protein [Nocardioides marinisabuli]
MTLTPAGSGALRPVVIGVDVGGTKVMAAEVAIDGTVTRVARRATPGRRVDVALLEDALSEAVLEVADGRRVAGVGLAAAGFVDAAGERVAFAPHLPWRGHQVRARLTDRWGVPVFLDNDANCAARAESAHGSALGAADALVLTLGTGIGGALVVGGALHRGRNGMAGEFGHTRVVPDGRDCECGGHGCWEQYCSGNALVRAARAAMAADGPLASACAGDPAAVTGPMVTDAAHAGDPAALAAYAEIGEWLGIVPPTSSPASTPAWWWSAAGCRPRATCCSSPPAALGRSLVGAPHRVVPPLLRARYGPEAGVVGAADLVREGLGRHARPRA